MKNILLPIILVMISVSWAVEIRKRYHQEVGIPLARQINTTEEATSRNRRSAGGGLASIYAYPFVAGLIAHLKNSEYSVCSATLLSHRHLVSAAQCWYDGEDQTQFYTVVLGSVKLFSGGLRINTADVVTHYKWDPHTLLNDISIIFLPKNIRFSPTIVPVTLPSKADVSKTFAGYRAMVVGFGITGNLDSIIMKHRTLSHAKLKVITNRKCSRMYEGIMPRSQMCTSGHGNVGICEGDTGGPLVVRKNLKYVLIGISSYSGVTSCPRDVPSGYTRVTAYYDFIHHYI